MSGPILLHLNKQASSLFCIICRNFLVFVPILLYVTKMVQFEKCTALQISQARSNRKTKRSSCAYEISAHVKGPQVVKINP